MARACYANADIYLLDDPLSAVDAQVANRLFENCIKGFLRSKAVILVTHQLAFLPKVSRILALHPNGTLAFYGPSQEYIERPIRIKHQ